MVVVTQRSNLYPCESAPATDGVDHHLDASSAGGSFTHLLLRLAHRSRRGRSPRSRAFLTRSRSLSGRRSPVPISFRSCFVLSWCRGAPGCHPGTGFPSYSSCSCWQAPTTWGAISGSRQRLSRSARTSGLTTYRRSSVFHVVRPELRSGSSRASIRAEAAVPRSARARRGSARSLDRAGVAIRRLGQGERL